MRYRNNSNGYQPRNMYAKYAGKCRCCGADIKAGEYVSYYPALKAIAHVGGLEGNGQRCFVELKKQEQRDAGFVDLDRAYEDQCSEICGR